jgi:hypothetical protein
MKNLLFLIIILTVVACNAKENKGRVSMSLNGNWDITKTASFDELPAVFNSKAHVPGLVDLAVPAIDTNRLFDNGIYWYRTNFKVKGKYPERVQLRIGKAQYHARVFVNGKYVGEQVYCFTAKEYDVREFLNKPGQNNELLIGVGTINNMPDTVILGKDHEKLTYIPGVYDDVTLTLSGYPFITNIQTVPDIEKEQLRVVASIERGNKEMKEGLAYQVRELQSGKLVAEGQSQSTDFTVSLPGCKLWSPESPFLYELMLSTGTDDKTVRFGMRSFRFNAKTGYAELNGKTYFMRGTNACVYRFFEDPDRGMLPWNDQWVIKLHERFKEMHWNSMRYSIGLPPERWYDIADSLGFLLQNEYPIWTKGRPDGVVKVYPGMTAGRLANEFRQWLPEHWNHPSVVIWDAQNETISEITGEAIEMVRGMDLSDRPWENGWAAPGRDTDPIETHPYLFMRYRYKGEPSEKGALSDLMYTIHVPDNDVNQHNPPQDRERFNNPMIINEYEWLWLNRDGSTTTLTDRVYDVVFGKNLTKEERIYNYCRYLGMITEYWRAHRLNAGILHFSGLAYSRPLPPRGQTSDHFIDIENLVYEPQFVKYVKPSFAPVFLMINYWEKKALPGETIKFDLYGVNDLYDDWQGVINLTVSSSDKKVFAQDIDLSIKTLGREIIPIQIKLPTEPGFYTITAAIECNGEVVKSIREFVIE